MDQSWTSCPSMRFAFCRWTRCKRRTVDILVCRWRRAHGLCTLVALLKFNPRDPHWWDRDRFILSAGHGSMLLYSLLYLTGYELPLEQIQAFRQWESMTPGHPERGLAPGVETTTGPLGQGFGNGIGMAIAETYLAADIIGRPQHRRSLYLRIVSDGDLMEGISHEAASLAGHLKLGKLIYLYDNNHISLASSTNLTFTEDVQKRFEAYGWHVQQVPDGNDIDAIDSAIRTARSELERPSLIMIRTTIGYGAPHKQNTFEVHGAPLGPDEVKAAKQNLGWPLDRPSMCRNKCRLFSGAPSIKASKPKTTGASVYSVGASLS